MWEYVICVVIWVVFIFLWIIKSIRERKIFAIYAECGIAICLTLLVLGLFGWFYIPSDILVLRILGVIGNIIYWSGAPLAVISLITLRCRGKPKDLVENTTLLIESGIFRVIRHPLYVGLAFWSIGLILLIQSIPSTILGMVALFCFWMASKKEDEFNIKKFGDSYKEYMKNVPMWNFLKGLRNLKKLLVG